MSSSSSSPKHPATNPQWRLATQLLHNAPNRTIHGETSEAIFLTSGFVYDSAEQAAATFEGTVEHYQYARYGSPTVDTLQERLCLLEGAEACLTMSSGMGAISCALLSQVKSGDRVVAAKALFGSTHWLMTNLLPSYGVETVLVDGLDENAWKAALSIPTKAVLIETPSNPMLDILDIGVIAGYAHKAGAVLMVDNVFATPVGQRPLALGADVVIYSCTKHLDGQGRALGGAVLGSRQWITDVLRPFVRNTGNSLSPFNAWVMLKGLETLDLRARTMAQNALQVAQALKAMDGVKNVRYPGLPDHPQAELARKQMRDGGSLIAFEVVNGQEGAFACMNSFSIIAISNNLGDARSLATHPATTTHKKISPEERAELGIHDGVIRLSVGLEDPIDLIEELKQATDTALAL
ncbi:aminotransferase class I/II-fold pyridoxal phosphate-dependent enzyme [Acetobacteraceae bacterium ESL0709]|nr:aminotransferase class I/II-fold pyridoxal phosphate-dependent enzyme [Acetobacteraceae bacterium ESL0697]MDF7677582.1 aminotransferase class I/II-fold pyridoxal phosphate-dependent enzyme [Acetobacteraceae bacterium ESL0709]